MQAVIEWAVANGYPIIFAMLLLSGIGVPVPEDIPLIAAGILSDRGGMSVPMASLACGVFVLARDSIVFGLGRRYGNSVLRHPWMARFISPETVAKAEEQLEQRGAAVVFAGRFIPGFRAAVFFAAGASGVRPLVFVGMDALAALISLPAFIWVGAAFSANFDQIRMFVGRFRTAGLVLAGLIGAVMLLRWWLRRGTEDAEVSE